MGFGAGVWFFFFPQLCIAFPHLLDLTFSPGGLWCLSEKSSAAAGLLPLCRGSQGPPRSERIPVSCKTGWGDTGL